MDILDIAKVLTAFPAIMFLLATGLSFLLVIDGKVPGETFKYFGKGTLITWGSVLLFEGAYCLGILFPKVAPVAPYIGIGLGGIECLALAVFFCLSLVMYHRDGRRKPSE